MTPQAAFDLGLGELSLTLPAGARERLLDYIKLLVKWNRTYNLTAIRDPLAMVAHHLLDSLAVAPHLALAPHARLADVGSGAGLPGIPLAIARPDWRVALAEASQKKAAFLRQAAIELAMAGAAPTALPASCRLIPLRVPLLDAQRHLVLCPASLL
jgi:16S rRNA (guanine527-N7)-methyltransferase